MSRLNWTVMQDLTPKDQYDEGMLYQRISLKFREDMLAGLFRDETLNALAGAIATEACPEGKWTYGTTLNGFHNIASRTLHKSALSILSTEARDHMASVAQAAIFPASTR